MDAIQQDGRVFARRSPGAYLVTATSDADANADYDG
jgi:hypothetical protein